MKIISVFNNKGGVGKTTLAYHLACALSELEKKVLIIDMDPQCNITLCCVNQEFLERTWAEEDEFIDDYDTNRLAEPTKFLEVVAKPRTIHFLLKSVEDGTEDLADLPPIHKLKYGPYIIPGRLTLHKYEYKISERWSGLYQGDPLSIRTLTRLRQISETYANKYELDYVIIDTSPSLGVLNKSIITMVDGFLIPCLPDMFSLYGIKNIGNYLSIWKKELDIIYDLISKEKRKNFPVGFVRFLGYTIYNAKKYSQNPQKNEWDLARGAYGYAKKIPSTIKEYIPDDVRSRLTEDLVKLPIGGISVMHTHNTLVNSSQKYNVPLWRIPSIQTSKLDSEDKNSLPPFKNQFLKTKENYIHFAEDLISRLSL